jgi:hypothetical protein
MAFPTMVKKGKRLYCPICKDNGFFSEEQLASVDGKVDCGNHNKVVLMVNLAEYLEIMGHAPAYDFIEPEPKVEFA